MKINTEKISLPRCVMIHGQDGIGKTTLASKLPNHLILNIEGGCYDIDCRYTDRIKNWVDLVTTMKELTSPDLPVDKLEWLVIDTLDWVEKLIFHDVAANADKKNIAEIGYGKGYALAMGQWELLIKDIDAIRRQHNCNVLLLAHTQNATIRPPDMESYQQWRPKLRAEASEIWREYCDEVFFAGFKVYLRKEEGIRERTIGVGGTERFLRTRESAGIMAKRRVDLPDEMPLDWEQYFKAI